MDAAEKLATEIAETFGKRPARMGREWRCNCPVHEAEGHHKPSLAIWPTGEASYGVKCMTGCPGSMVWAALRARGIKGTHRGGAGAEDMAKARVVKERHRVEQLMKVQTILSEAEAIIAGGASGLYLASRGLELSFEGPGINTLFEVDDPGPGAVKAFGACIVDPTTLALDRPKVVGVSLLSLNRVGEPVIAKATGKKLRSIIGAQSGYGVPFGKPGAHMVVAEGVESMLAARQLLKIEFGIATLAAPNMRSLAIPEFVQRVTIAADNDTPGLEAAADLANELGHLGMPVKIWQWGLRGTGFDAADELMRRKS